MPDVQLPQVLLMANLEAGTGDYDSHLLYPKGCDNLPLRMQEHYIGVDAVSWYVQKESGFFKKLSASGTLKLSVAGESYEVGLGLYELADGAKSAPIFDRPVLPERVFRGGPITVSARITAIGRDQVVGRLLKATASSALGVVKGMVQTAGVAGPALPLAEAGATLMGGVRQLLDEQPKDQQLLSEGGIERSITPDRILGEQTYLLLRRGGRLKESQLSVVREGSLDAPHYNGEPLRDGAWLLLRFRRVAEYPLQRDWYPQVRKLITDLIGLVDDVKAGTIAKEQATSSLKPGSESQPSMYDEYRRLRSIVLSDGVLTQAEAGGYAATLAEIRRLATTAILSGDYQAFNNSIGEFRASVFKGGPSSDETRKSITDALRAAGALRPLPAGVDQPSETLGFDQASISLKNFKRLNKLLPQG
jgi:hypothetical protein